MKISIEAKVLAKAMKNAAEILSATDILPICGNVRLIAKGKSLEITTCDLESEYRQTLPLAAKGEMEATVNARKLLALSQAAPDGATLNLSLGDNRMTITHGRGRWVLSVLPADQFPTLPVETLGAPMEVFGPTLGQALRRVEWAIYNGSAQMHLQGVLLQSEQGKARFVAVNGNAMAINTINADFPADAVDAMIPTRFVSTLASLADGHDGPVSLAWDGRKIRAEMGDLTLTGKLMDANFPDYRRVIPPIDAEPAMIDPALVAEALKRVMVIADEKTRRIKLGRGADKMTLAASDGSAGQSDEDVPASCAEGFESGVNGQYLAKVLTSIGGDTIEIHQADAKAPILFRRAVPDGAMAIVMPMKI